VTDETDAGDPEHDVEADDEGPGWMPAILAGTLLMGIVGFIVCAFSTWILFQKRTEFAIRTLKGSYVLQLEQSLLDPESKLAVVKEINGLIADLERGKYENWQAAGIMQRLQRLPVIQWGELQAIEAFLKKEAGDEQAGQIEQLSRLRRAVELGMVTSFDVEDVLQPVRRPDPNAATGSQLVQPLNKEQVSQVVHRARLAADRAAVPNQHFDGIRIESIVRSEIERGASEGSF
jgi:hypothetical protein